jgi:hypothetical protein
MSLGFWQGYHLLLFAVVTRRLKLQEQFSRQLRNSQGNNARL